MYTEDEFLMISGIQHFSFCRRQWALIHVEDKWTENYLTVTGNIVHKRVHNKSVQDVRNNVLTIRGLDIKSSGYGISGTCDAVEFYPVEEGIHLNGLEGTWQPAPVEYKRGKTKVNDCDRLQVVAQAICLEEMFSCRIEYGYVFYHETRRREKVDITMDFREKLEEMLEEMHAYYRRGYTPVVKATKKCGSCSLSNECMPSLLGKKESVATYVNRYLKGEDYA